METLPLVLFKEQAELPNDLCRNLRKEDFLLVTCSYLNKKTNFQIVPTLNGKMAHTIQMCRKHARVGYFEKCVGNIPAKIFLQNSSVPEEMKRMVEYSCTYRKKEEGQELFLYVQEA